MDVHRKFAIAVRSSARPADDFAINFRNNGWITTCDGLKPCSLIFRRTRPDFICGNTLLDALIVNFSNRRGVICGRGPNLYVVHVWTFVRAITLVQLRRLLHRSLVRMPAALRATRAWRTSHAAGIFGPPASR